MVSVTDALRFFIALTGNALKEMIPKATAFPIFFIKSFLYHTKIKTTDFCKCAGRLLGCRFGLWTTLSSLLQIISGRG
jgi:hypothetical protein